MAADQILHAGLFGPAVGFVGLEFEFGDGFDRVTGWEDFGVGGVKLVGGGGGAGESAVGFFVEASGDGFDGVGEEIIVIGNHDCEAGLKGGELS